MSTKFSWFSRRTEPTPPSQRKPWRRAGSPASGHASGLPFGMAAYPDLPPPPKPWFGGPTPAPTPPPIVNEPGADL